MKKFATLIASAMVCALFSACGNSADLEDTNPSIVNEKTSKAISLNFNEEMTPMTKYSKTRAGDAEGKKIYGINIYESDGKEYKMYAYGVFDNPSSISIIMNEERKYEIEVMEFQNDEDTVYHEGNTFYHPFMVGKTKPSALTNTFTYDKTENLSDIRNGKTRLGKDVNDTARYARAYRYYGVVEDFDPSTTNTLSVNVRRAIFGIHFIITPPGYGNVRLRFLNNRYIDVKAGEEVYDHQSVYAFNHMEKAIDDNYKSQIPVRAIWTADGDTIYNDSIHLPVQHNVMTTLAINFKGPKPLNGGTITEDNTEMGKDSVGWTVTAK